MVIKLDFLLFAEEIETYLPPAKGQKKHVLRILREILFFKNRTKLTNLNEGLRFINKVMRRRAVVFFLSDFIISELPNEEEVEEQMEDLFYKEISSTKKRHDLICAQVGDPCEFKLLSTGLTTFEDAESGEFITIDLSNQKCRAQFEENVFARQNNLLKNSKEEESISSSFQPTSSSTKHSRNSFT